MLTPDKAAYWFLDAAIEKEIHVGVLNRERDYVEGLLNRGHHGLTSRQIVETLFGLFQRGEIHFVPFECEDLRSNWTGDLKHSMPVTLKDLDAAVTGREWMGYYFLTPQGGAHWEALSCPDWHRFFEGSGLDSELTSTVWGGSREIIERYLTLSHYRCPVIEASKVWTELTPWQATYWKTLPQGYRVDYRITQVNPWDEPRDEPPWVNKQWAELGDWYTNYLEQ